MLILAQENECIMKKRIWLVMGEDINTARYFNSILLVYVTIN